MNANSLAKIVAGVIGLAGIVLLIITRTTITGGVIGAGYPNPTSMIGLGLLFVSLVLFWMVFREKKRG